MKNTKILILTGILLTLFVGTVSLVYTLQSRQEIRSRAAPSTTLYITPSTTDSSPLKADIGDIINLDFMIDPGANLPSVVKLDINFDSSKFKIEPTGFLVNLAAFSTTLEGPVLTDGNLKISVSIGSDATKAIQEKTKIGTLTLTAISSTPYDPAMIAFGRDTFVLSVGDEDHATENTLASSLPAYIIIIGPVLPTPAPQSTYLTVTTFLHGIGAAGDNTNPTDSRLSNKAPQNLTRKIDVSIFDKQNQPSGNGSGTLQYDPEKGSFTGNISIDSTLPHDLYKVKVSVPTYLHRFAPGIVSIKPLEVNKLEAVTLVAGDINNDNILNIIDYNILINCYSDLEPPKACTPENKILSDINDDGLTNHVDYNLFLREVSTQIGN